MLVIGAGATEISDDITVNKIELLAWQPFVGARERADFSRFSQRALPNLPRLWTQIIKFKPDVVVCRGLTSMYIIAALPLIWLTSKLALYTQGPRERPWQLSRWLINSFLLWLVGGRWFTPVQRRGPMGCRAWVDRRITFVPFAMKASLAAANRTWQSSPIRVLAIGKYEPRKNHDALIRALCLTSPDVAITIAGEVSTTPHKMHLERLQALVTQVGLKDRVEFLVNVPNNEMGSLFLKSDIYLQMSSNEPASVSQLEAMAHGLGVVINPDNGTASYVADGVNGFHCSPEPSEIAQVLNILCQTPELLRRFGRTNYEEIVTMYDIECVANRLLKVLRR